MSLVFAKYRIESKLTKIILYCITYILMTNENSYQKIVVAYDHSDDQNSELMPIVNSAITQIVDESSSIKS